MQLMAEKKDPKEEKPKEDTSLDKLYRTLMGEKGDKKKGE